MTSVKVLRFEDELDRDVDVFDIVSFVILSNGDLCHERCLYLRVW